MKTKHYALLLATSLALSAPLLCAQTKPQTPPAAAQAAVQAIKAGLTFDEAEALLMQAQEGDAPALARLQTAGAQGNAHAQINLANIYFEGHGVKQNYAQAIEWFTKAAAQGELEAQVYLGLMHAEGRGVPQSDAIALQWLGKASASSTPHVEYVMLHLVNLYLDDIQESKQPSAWIIGGRVVSYLLGKPPTPVHKILAWLRQNADKGPRVLYFVVGALHSGGFGLSPDYPVTLKFLRQGAEKGSPAAQFNLGSMYLEGKGVPRNDTEAFKWIRKAGEQGAPMAALVLAGMYHTGLGVARDQAESDKWSLKDDGPGGLGAVISPIGNKLIRKLAVKGDAKAQDSLGWRYQNSRNTPPNNTLAFKWFRRAADQGLADAQFHLGDVYQGGLGVAKDSSQAMQWYRLAALQGHSQAQFILGMAYSSGQGLPRDDAQAYQWLVLAQKTAKADDYFLPKKALPIALRLLEKRMRPEQLAQANKAVTDWLAAHPAPAKP